MIQLNEADYIVVFCLTMDSITMSESPDAQGTPPLKCGICLTDFKDPRTLPCLHSYCLQCLKSYVSSTKGRGKRFRCPQCREKVKIPGGDVKNFARELSDHTVDASSGAADNNIPGKPPGESLALSDVQQPDYASSSPSASRTSDDNPQGEAEDEREEDVQDESETPTQSEQCAQHPEESIIWYCRTCSRPACSSCMLEKHHNHDTEKLSATATMMKQELGDVFNLAANRIEFLQKMSTDIKSNQRRMEQELDKASSEVSSTADTMCKLIRQQEATLQTKIKEARKEARVHFARTKEDLEQAISDTSNLKSTADPLLKEQSQCELVVQAPVSKLQFLQQQGLRLPSVWWNLDRTVSAESRDEPFTAASLGTIELSTSVEPVRKIQTKTGELGEPIRTIKMVGEACTDNSPMSAIAELHQSLTCVAYCTEDMWVYTNSGHLKETIQIPDIHNIYAMVTVGNDQDKLAIVDGTNKLHFVTLSVDLEILEHVVKDMPVKATRLSQNIKGQLVATHAHEDIITVLSLDGEVVSSLALPIPHNETLNATIIETQSGFVICDFKSQKVYFTNVSGHILHTSTDFVTQHIVHTSWGHLLIPDFMGNHVRIFSDTGDFLGNLQDDDGSLTDPHYVHVDEKERLLYVGRGTEGDDEIRVYNFVPSNLPSLPVNLAVSKLEVNLKMNNIMQDDNKTGMALTVLQIQQAYPALNLMSIHRLLDPYPTAVCL